jgi:hypothetical protein
MQKRQDMRSVPVVNLKAPKSGNPVVVSMQKVKNTPKVQPVTPTSVIEDMLEPTVTPSLRSLLTKSPRIKRPDRTKWKNWNISTDYLKFIPDTGVTRYYELTVDEATLAPDGVDAPYMQVFNGQFPGPLLEADWGDKIEIKVHNKLTNNGTSIHWHGFVQTNSSLYDGVNGVTQCPIPPGGSMVYKIRAERYGTSWVSTPIIVRTLTISITAILVFSTATVSMDLSSFMALHQPTGTLTWAPSTSVIGIQRTNLCWSTVSSRLVPYLQHQPFSTAKACAIPMEH